MDIFNQLHLFNLLAKYIICSIKYGPPHPIPPILCCGCFFRLTFFSLFTAVAVPFLPGWLLCIITICGVNGGVKNIVLHRLFPLWQRCGKVRMSNSHPGMWSAQSIMLWCPLERMGWCCGRFMVWSGLSELRSKSPQLLHKARHCGANKISSVRGLTYS